MENPVEVISVLNVNAMYDYMGQLTDKSGRHTFTFLESSPDVDILDIQTNIAHEINYSHSFDLILDKTTLTVEFNGEVGINKPFKVNVYEAVDAQLINDSHEPIKLLTPDDLIDVLPRVGLNINQISFRFERPGIYQSDILIGIIQERMGINLRGFNIYVDLENDPTSWEIVFNNSVGGAFIPRKRNMQGDETLRTENKLFNWGLRILRRRTAKSEP